MSCAVLGTLIAAMSVGGGAPPTPGRALLDAPGPVRYTARLVAQASNEGLDPAQAGMEVDLEADMERARARVEEVRAAQPVESVPTLGVRDGHDRGYYRTWATLLWIGAGAAWGAGGLATVTGLSWWGKAIKDRPLTESERRNIFTGGDPDGWSRAEYEGAAIAATVGAVALTAAGGVLAWLAGRSFGTYRELDAEVSASLRARQLEAAPDWRAPIPGWTTSPPPMTAEPRRAPPPRAETTQVGPRHSEHRHTHQGTWDRYEERDRRRHLERDPADPAWRAYLERIRARRLERERAARQDGGWAQEPGDARPGDPDPDAPDIEAPPTEPAADPDLTEPAASPLAP